MPRLASLLIGLFILVTAVHSQPLNSATDYAERGRERARAGDLDRAIADFTQAIQIYERNATFLNSSSEIWQRIAEAYYDRANAQYRNRKLDLAIADYTKALEINPNYARAYDGRGTHVMIKVTMLRRCRTMTRRSR